jgi:hypothetical protein
VSVPHLLKRLSKKAREALPENGRKTSRGKISLGIPSLENSGIKSLDIASQRPEPRSILTETISAHIEGRSEKAPLAPLAAPSKKHEK